MANTVVIFGMAHSGKSTCGGYIYNYSMQGKTNYDFEKNINKIKEKLGEAYDASRDFGYLLDKSKDEMLRTKAGTSKRLHIKSIQCNDSQFVIVDTPGAQHRATQRQKGMYYGDIGVFCVEIEKIIDERFLSNKKQFLTFMSTLILWSKFKRKTIIALTKMDIAGFSEEKYIHACGILKQLCQDLDISAIIPIYINVKERKGHNIFDRSLLMEWYNGKTLMTAVKEAFCSIESERKEDSLIFYVDHSYMQSLQHTGKSWRIKVIRGEIKVGQKITLSPVVINQKYYSVTAVVKSIRADLDSIEEVRYIDSAAEGSFVGIDLSDIYCGKRRLDKREMNTICTTCGFSSHYQFSISNECVFRVGVQYLEKLGIRRQMNLLWFGRAVTFEILSRKNTSNGIEVRVRTMKEFLALPVDENGRYVIEHLIIKYDNNLNQDPFMEAELLKIGGEI